MAFNPKTFNEDIYVAGKTAIGNNIELGFGTAIGYIGATTGTNRTITALGSQTNISIDLIPKGTSTVRVPTGYTSLITDVRDITNKDYVDTHLGGKSVFTLITNPTVTQNGFSVIWDNTNNRYTLAAITPSNYTFASGTENVSGTIKLGGTALDRNTDITGAFNLSLGTSGSKLANLYSNITSTIDLIAGTTNIGRIQVNTGTDAISLIGGSGSIFSNIRITNSGLIVLLDGQTSPRGLAGSADYSANVQLFDFVQRTFTETHLGSKPVSNLLRFPNSGQNGYAVVWDNSILQYTLQLITSGGGGGTSNSKEQSFVGDGTTSIFTVSNGTVTLLSFVDAGGNVQQQGIDYVRSGQNIDFGTPLPIGLSLTVHYFEDLSVSPGGGGHTILANTTPLTQRTNLSFKNGITASDTGGNTLVILGGVLTQNTNFSGAFSLTGSGLTAFQFNANNVVLGTPIGGNLQIVNETTSHFLRIGESAGVIFNVGSDVDEDIYKRSSGKFIRIPVGANGTYLGVTGGVVGYSTPSGGSGATSGSGTTVVGTAVNLGAPLTADATLTGAFTINLGTISLPVTSLLSEATNTIQFRQGSKRFALATGIGVILDLGSDAIGDIYTRSNTGALARIADIAINNVLLSGGVGIAPTYGKITESMFNIPTGILLGRTTASTGIAEDIIVSNGVTLASGTLKVGGPLTANTTISGSSFKLTFSNIGLEIGGGNTMGGIFHFVMGGANTTSGNYGLVIGTNNVKAGSIGTIQVGVYTSVNNTGLFAGGTGFDATKPILATGNAAFNFSNNTTAQVAGHGVLGANGAILGGQDHNIDNTVARAVILGGDGIKLTNAGGYSDFVAVPSLAIFTTPSAGSTDDVLTWNATSKKIGKVTQASLGGGGGISDGDKGDITVSASGATWTIDNNVVTLAKFQDIVTSSFLGRITAATGDPEVLSSTQATTLINTFTTTLKGLVPPPTSIIGNRFLAEDGTWTTTPGGITNTAINNEIPKSDGTNIVPSGLFSTTAGNIDLGNASTTGGTRIITVTGSSANVGLSINAKGNAPINLATTSGVGMTGTGSDGIFVDIATNKIRSTTGNLILSSVTTGNLILDSNSGLTQVYRGILTLGDSSISGAIRYITSASSTGGIQEIRIAPASSSGIVSLNTPGNGGQVAIQGNIQYQGTGNNTAVATNAPSDFQGMGEFVSINSSGTNTAYTLPAPNTAPYQGNGLLPRLTFIRTVGTVAYTINANSGATISGSGTYALPTTLYSTVTLQAVSNTLWVVIATN